MIWVCFHISPTETKFSRGQIVRPAIRRSSIFFMFGSRWISHTIAGREQPWPSILIQEWSHLEGWWINPRFLLCWAYLQLAWKNENRDSPESLSLYLGWILNLRLGTWSRACQFSDFNLLLMIRWVPVMNETGRVCVCRERSHNVRWQWLPPCHQHPPTTMKGHYRSSSQGHHIN